MNDYLCDNFTEAGTALTIGKFDGLHEGHRRLIEACVVSSAEEGLKSIVPFVCFPGQKRIFSPEETCEMLSELGVDEAFPLMLGPEAMNESAAHFLTETLLKRYHMKHFFSGDDFCFGKNREGTPAFLREAAQKYGFTYTEIPTVVRDGQAVKSTDAREALLNGRMDEVFTLLSRHYRIEGRIIHGQHLGTKMHFPTANLKPDASKLLPPYGVYLVRAKLHGMVFEGIANLGVRPTVSDQGEVLLETHFPGYHEDLYGETIAVEFLRFLRPERRFDSVSALKAQIEADMTEVHRIFKKSP